MKKSQSKSLIEQNGGWEGVYRNLSPEDLPWNAGGPDPDLVRLVESGIMKEGPAIDIGTGPGHDAVYLAQNGFRVLAVDIAPKAIALAKANAKKAGVQSSIRFRVADILRLKIPAGRAALIYDRGCFHTLPPESQKIYIDRVHAALRPSGFMILRTFSDKEPPGPGPRRFSREELDRLFAPRFIFEEISEGVFEGPLRPKAYFLALRKKPPSARKT